MHEMAWLRCADPDAMLRLLSGRVSERKLRLFACACQRWLRKVKDKEAKARA
jgi:hypothetical protein